MCDLVDFLKGKKYLDRKEECWQEDEEGSARSVLSDDNKEGRELEIEGEVCEGIEEVMTERKVGSGKL